MTGFLKVQYGSLYIRSVEVLLNDLKRNGDKLINPYKIPLIVSSAAALETILNEAIIIECQHRLPNQDVKRITNSHLGMSLGGKLDNLGWMLTDNEYVVDNQSVIYQSLRSIIKYRNETMHFKAYYREVDHSISDEGESSYTLNDKALNATANDIGIDEFELIYKAILELSESIVNITSTPPIIKNDLFKENA